MNVFGERMQDLRKDLKITQDEMALTLNVTKGAVSGWERGIREPNTEMQKKISTILNTTVSYLIGEIDNPNANTEPTYQELYQKLVEANPNNDIHFFNVEDLNQHDLELIQTMINTLKSQKKIKK
jgi:Predicted transcriptional regulators